MKTNNVYQMVTDRITEQLGKGIIPWQKPWTGDADNAINYVSRRPYSLINQFLLGKAGEWLSFKQVKDLGGSIKKGAKSRFVVFFTMVAPKGEDINEMNDVEKEIKLHPVLRYYNVFHLDDTTGIPTKIKGIEPDERIKPIEKAEQVIADYLSREKTLKFHNDKVSNDAYYSPAIDEVVIPMLTQYAIAEEYYSTAFHELTHSTITSSRCDRKSEMKVAAFRNEDYSREELVAEIGSAMICNRIGIDCAKAFKNSVAYIQGWLRALKNDNKMIVWASSRAEKAARYIIGDPE